MIPWQPRYTLTPAMARRLMEIKAARAGVEQIPLPPAVVAEMRNRARLRSTHYPTRIEGNRLTLAEAGSWSFTAIGPGARAGHPQA
jgi:hypothetical protein